MAKVDAKNPANHLFCIKPYEKVGYSPSQLVKDMFLSTVVSLK